MASPTAKLVAVVAMKAVKDSSSLWVGRLVIGGLVNGLVEMLPSYLWCYAGA